MEVPWGPLDVVDTPDPLDAVVADVAAEGSGKAAPVDVDDPPSGPVLETAGPHPSRARPPTASGQRRIPRESHTGAPGPKAGRMRAAHVTVTWMPLRTGERVSDRSDRE